MLSEIEASYSTTAFGNDAFDGTRTVQAFTVQMQLIGEIEYLFDDPRFPAC
jgi:hypothetical protein